MLRFSFICEHSKIRCLILENGVFVGTPTERLNFKYKFGRAVPERITSKERTDMPKSGCTLRNKLRFDKWQLFVGAFVMAVDIPPVCTVRLENP
ncbi:hypothetical protein OOU_Y34scaffold00452g2 [Pyricularia oryzae Y34]|uniref:Uncharacterized protein n=1 Tax=Pyricularia oryzae (strain Y34) TaxID=1143189 RepID=A0AA97P1I9_PYRO3|nr:hypothetical protein OOU_Y34scaffold00452g2 [Pyricularia oryzae Y34]